MYRIAFLVLLTALTAACATPEWYAERGVCRGEWFERIPPRYAYRWVEDHAELSHRRNHPDCRRAERERRRLPSFCPRPGDPPPLKRERYDVNAAERNPEILRCVRQRCRDAYGNADCEVPGQTYTIPRSLRLYVP